MKTWQQQLRHLKEFRAVNEKRWPGPSTRFPGRNPLGKWCARQQGAYRGGKLSRPQLRALIDIGFPLTPEKSIWEKRRRLDAHRGKGLWVRWFLRLEDLRAYRRRFPDSWPPRRTNAAYWQRSLGMWLYKQKRRWLDGKLDPDRRKLLAAVGYRPAPVIDFEKVWMEHFERLKAFRRKFPGRWPEWRDEFPQGVKLGLWTGTQRMLYKQGKLPKQRKRLLVSMGLPLGDVLEEAWMRQYNHLKVFRKRHPKAWPERKTECPPGNNLGQWFSDQKKNANKGELSEERRKLLGRIGFPFSDVYDDQWHRNFERLKGYLKKHSGEWPMENPGQPESYRLAHWCGYHRKRAKEGKVPPERLRLLKSIGFSFEHANEDRWRTQFERLREYRRRHPDRWPEFGDEFPPGNRLGLWVHRIRKENLEGQAMFPYRRRLLEGIGFPFEAAISIQTHNAWNRRLPILKAFVAKKRRFPEPEQSRKKEYRLYAWCLKLRRMYHSGTLDPGWKSELDAMGFPFAGAKETAWMKHFDALKAYRKRNPERWPKYNKKEPMGPWIERQKKRWKERSLEKDRVRLLKEIGLIKKWTSSDSSF